MDQSGLDNLLITFDKMWRGGHFGSYWVSRTHESRWGTIDDWAESEPDVRVPIRMSTRAAPFDTYEGIHDTIELREILDAPLGSPIGHWDDSVGARPDRRRNFLSRTNAFHEERRSSK